MNLVRAFQVWSVVVCCRSQLKTQQLSLQLPLHLEAELFEGVSHRFDVSYRQWQNGLRQ